MLLQRMEEQIERELECARLQPGPTPMGVTKDDADRIGMVSEEDDDEEDDAEDEDEDDDDDNEDESSDNGDGDDTDDGLDAMSDGGDTDAYADESSRLDGSAMV